MKRFSTPLSGVLATGLLVVIAILVSQCRGSAGPTSQAGRVVESPGTKTLDGKGAVHRYTTDLFAALRSAERNPYVIPAKSMVVITRSGGSSDDPRGPRPTRKEDGKLFILASAGVPNVTAMLGLGIRAEDYNELRIRMRVNNGEHCTLTWTTDVEPSSMRSQGLTIPIFSDNEIHSYRVPLGGLTAQSWVGLVKSLVLRPSNLPADVEIESMELGFVAPESPSRITIAAQTHEAAFGSQPPWKLTIPANASLSTYIGLPEDTWANGRSASARFVATMDTDKQKGVLLLDQALTPTTDESHRNWIPFKADLSGFAGQRATIRFTISGVNDKPASPACWGDPRIAAVEPDCAAVPVVLVSCDTLRADHLSCYGHYRETTPNLDALAKEGVLFENAISVETWTLPSHASMFTGLYPKHHGVTPNANLAESTVTLPETLRDAGYVTGGFIGFTFWLYPWRGFSHGFDVYNTPDWRFRKIQETHRFAESWINAVQAPNFFLFLHNFDVHSKPAKQFDGLPYGPEDPKFLHFAKEFANPPSFQRPERDMVDAEAFLNAANAGEVTMTQEEIEYCKALYDDALRMVDASLGEMFESLKKRGLYERALIIVTADHGEEFGEHGTFGHGNVYEPSLHIPMIVKFPNAQFAGTRFKPVVELVDIMPTILDVIGAPAPEGLDGKSMLRMLRSDETPKEQGYSQRFLHKTVRETEWKLIRTRPETYELYNVSQDPGETNNLADSQPDQVARMRPPLEEFFKVNPQGWHIAFETPAHDYKGTVTISTEDVIESAELLGGQDVTAMNVTDRGVTLNVGKIDRAKRDELIVRTVGTSGRMSLTIKSPTDFSVALGDQPVATGKAFRVVLDPAAKAYPQPEVSTDPATGLRFRIWYVQQTGTRSAAQHLSPEAIEELKNLGYTGE
ncbi:MAG: sulfatase [Candidatus Hydrogenedentes bacterium]|nr:sulfatase [Candidatus Hydrogenedentota bacterium]